VAGRRYLSEESMAQIERNEHRQLAEDGMPLAIIR
jgi:hypothetical protein